MKDQLFTLIRSVRACFCGAAFLFAIITNHHHHNNPRLKEFIRAGEFLSKSCALTVKL
jgi:hypothetical protein